MRYKPLALVAVVLVGMMLSPFFSSADIPLITLSSGRTLTAENALDMSEEVRMHGAEKQYYIVFIGRPTTPEDVALFNAQDILIHGYMHPYGYGVYATPEAVQHAGNIQYAWPYNTKYLVDKAIAAVEKQRVSVFFFNTVSQEEIVQALNERSVDVVEIYPDAVVVDANRAALEDIAVNVHGVSSMEIVPLYEIVNDNTSEIMKVNVVRDRFGLTGKEQVGAAADTGFDLGFIGPGMHGDYVIFDNNGGYQGSRVLNITDFVPASVPLDDGNPDDDHGHGTHISGTILGSGNLSGSNPKKHEYDMSFAGMAPEAEYIFGAFGLDDPSSLAIYVSGSGNITYFFDYFYQPTPKIPKVLSNSWTCTQSSCPTSPYTKSSQSTDAKVREFRTNGVSDFVVVGAAGNYAKKNSVKPPFNAKNSISVGGSYGSDVASFSSQGPTDDGRIKPDVIAPGVLVMSTRGQNASGGCSSPGPNPNYTICSGTSMATPAVSGTVLLLQEYYKRFEAHNDPSAALIKATLIAGTRTFKGAYISDEAGFGGINIEDSLPVPVTQGNPEERVLGFADDPNILLNTGDAYTQTIKDVNRNAPLVVVLAWTDFPGTVGSGKALVSDLDLVVTDTMGNRYYGNDFTAPYDDAPDDTNNVEKVVINNPVKTYTVSVEARNTPMGAQDFALVWRYQPAYYTAKDSKQRQPIKH